MAARGGFIARLVRSVAWGVVKGVIFYLVVVKVSPLISASLYASLSRDIQNLVLPAPRGVFLASGFLFIGLSTAAAALRGTIAEPLIRAVTAVIAFAFTALVLWGGALDVTVQEYGASLRVYLDLKPLLVTYFVFVTVPGALLPLVWYYYARAEAGDAHSPSG